jgi:hypothetical protein
MAAGAIGGGEGASGGGGAIGYGASNAPRGDQSLRLWLQPGNFALSGSSIDAWYDDSGNGNDFSFGSGGGSTRPVASGVLRDSKNVAFFDTGTAQLTGPLLSDLIGSGNEWTAAMVLWSKDDTAGNIGRAGAGQFSFAYGGGNAFAYDDTFSGGTFSHGWPNRRRPFIWIVRKSGGSVGIRRHDSTFSTNTATDPTEGLTDPFKLGGVSGNRWLAEVRIYDEAKGDTFVDALVDELYAKHIYPQRPTLPATPTRDLPLNEGGYFNSTSDFGPDQATDHSANEVMATMGGGTYPTWVNSARGSKPAMAFSDGSSNSLNLNDPQTTIIPSAGFTIAMWVRVTGGSSPSVSPGTEYTGRHIARGPTFGITRGTRADLGDAIYAWVYAGGLAYGIPAPYTVGTWMHLVYTHNGSTAKVYVDTVEEYSSSMPQPDTAAQNLHIGANTFGETTTSFQVQDFQAWGRSLSASEVEGLYNNTL